jgi:hypothetical protein
MAMATPVTTVEAYLDTLPADRLEAVKKLRATLKKHLPKGFTEGMGYGMIGYCVPHSIYPAGYHCDPTLPLPFISIANQKNYIALHHMGLYASPQLLQWFTDAYAQTVPTKLDMGKGCIRFKKPDQIPFELIAQLAAKLTPQQWVEQYEAAFRRK